MSSAACEGEERAMVALLHKIKGEFGRSEDAVDAKQDQDEAPNQHRNEHEHEHAHVNHEHESPEVEEGRSQERTPRGEDLADNTSTSLTAEAGAVAPIELTEEQKQMQALLEEFNSKGVPQELENELRTHIETARERIMVHLDDLVSIIGRELPQLLEIAHQLSAEREALALAANVQAESQKKQAMTLSDFFGKLKQIQGLVF